MQKKNKTLTLTLVLLLLVMVTLGTLGGTFAKYTSSAEGTDSARVAKWSFNVNETDITKSQTYTINLFSDTYTNVKGAEKVVAPGTTGKFDLVLTNNAEVTAKFGIEFTVTNEKNIPIEFSIDGNTWDENLAAIADEELAFNGGTQTVTVQWRWATETNEKDTALGVEGNAEITVVAKVTAEQVI